MFLYSSYNSLIIENGLKGYIWPDQDTAINQAVGDLREPLQAYISV